MTSKFFARLETQPYLLACCLMLLSTAAFSAMNTGVRLLAAEIDPVLVVALRTGITLDVNGGMLIH